jgi:hypothetical protein
MKPAAIVLALIAILVSASIALAQPMEENPYAVNINLPVVIGPAPGHR